MSGLEFRLPRERSRKLLKGTVLPAVMSVAGGAVMESWLVHGLRPPLQVIAFFGLAILWVLAGFLAAWYSAVCYTIADEDGISFGPRWPGKQRKWTWDEISSVHRPDRRGRLHVVHLETDGGRTIALPAPRRLTGRADPDVRFPEADQLVEFWRDHAPATTARRLNSKPNPKQKKTKPTRRIQPRL